MHYEAYDYHEWSPIYAARVGSVGGQYSRGVDSLIASVVWRPGLSQDDEPLGKAIDLVLEDSKSAGPPVS